MKIIHKIITQLSTSKALVLIDQAIVSGGNFLLGILLARFLGLEIFGLYSLLWMGVLFALSIHQAFMTKPLMSLFANRTVDAQQDYLQGLMVLQILVSVAIILLTNIVFIGLNISAVSNEWVGFLPLCGFLTASYLMQDFLRKTFFVKQRFSHPLLMDLVLYVPILMALPLLHFGGQLDLPATLTVMAVSYAISTGVGFFTIFRLKLINRPAFNWKQNLKNSFKEHYHYSFWLLGTSLVQWFSSNFFLIAAAGVLGIMAVGALRMAQNMVGLCHVLFLAMENIIPAKAAQHFFSDGKTKMYAYLKKVSLLGALPVMGMLLVLTLSAPVLIGWLYGAEYQDYSYLVGIYSLLYVFVYVGFPLRFALRTLQYTSPIFIAYCLSAGVSMLVAFPLARHFGMSGIMAGLIGTQILTLLVYTFFLHKQNKGIQPLETPSSVSMSS